MGRMVLRIIEMETYRMLALLGLPVARKYLSTLVQIEHKLTDLTQQLTEQISRDDTEVQALLPALSQLAPRLKKYLQIHRTGCRRPKPIMIFFWLVLKGFV